MQETNHIYPIFDKMMTRQDKESLLHQKGVMVWFTGLSGSGKSTIAIALERELHKRGFLCRILDGDNIRSGINNNLGFTEADRVENIRRIAEVGKLFVDTGIITLAAFISPNNEIREMAASIIGKDDFLYDENVWLRQYMDSHGYPYEYHESEGGHTWRNWRVYLSDFLQKLF